MMKSKGYSKGGAKMMKARGGKMAKGYSKGGAKMIKASAGIGVGGQKSNAARYGVGKFDKTGKKAGKTLGKFTANDIKVANRMMNAGMITGTAFGKLMKQVKPDFIKGRSELPKKTKPVAKSRLTASGKRDLAAFKKKKK